MKILHFILGKANPNRANGVNQVIYGLAKYSSLAGHKVYVIGISSSMSMKKEVVDRGSFQVEAFRSFNSGGFKRVRELARTVDIVHLHGVWNKYNISVGRYLERIHKPYIITAHNGYAIDLLKQSNYWAKLLYHQLWQKRLYGRAAGVHALTREEQTDLIQKCNNPNTFVIPNGVDPEQFDNNIYHLHQDRKKIRLGYIGRISKEKNLKELLKAFSLLPIDILSQVELYIIGPENKYAEELKMCARQYDISDQVLFLGAKYGDEKMATVIQLDVYIHPSCADVISIAVLEAFALGIPTIVTRTSKVSYFDRENAFIMVEPTAQDISRGIQEMIARRNEWGDISSRARALYKRIFNWRSAVDELLKEYRKSIEVYG